MGKTGKMLKELRVEKGLTLQEVANEIGCSASYLHRLENNSRKNPSMKVVQSLAEFYGIDVSEALGIDQGQMAEVVAAVELKQTIAEELNKAVEDMKEGLASFDQDDQRSKQAFVDVQKSLLYMQTLI